jgi:4-hydroxy-tetrahydrodipicolinate synthase
MKDKVSFRGAITALVTPFDSHGKLHEGNLKKLIDYQIQGGIDGIVPCGTTGEASTLDYDEHYRVCQLTVEHVAGRVKVIMGAGSNNTQEAVEQTLYAKKIGADGVLSVGPYYNKPTQEGYYQHFKAIAESTDIPVVVYNVPGRTGSNIEPGTLLRLAEIPNIVAVKEASGNLDQMMSIIKGRPQGFTVLSGDDSLALPLIAAGGDGCISVVANEVPADFSQLIHAALEDDWKRAREIHYRLLPLMRANFMESNPIPVKGALALMEMIDEAYRLPMTPLQEKNKEKMAAILKELKLIG